ncbi:MAG: aryl-alcohol dehydrogenase-like predicted oxidoreductase [Natronomonas sp.]|jgi:aryl-alcohol dehydrogenase-like predicted oxidoreductase
MIDADESRAIIDRAIDLGFFDTANVYSDGGSEEILGETISGYDRDSLVLATKVFGEMDESTPKRSPCTACEVPRGQAPRLHRFDRTTQTGPWGRRRM